MEWSGTMLPNVRTLSRAVVVVKWSACFPSTPTIRVRFPLTLIVFSVFEKNENKQKETWVGPFLEKNDE